MLFETLVWEGIKMHDVGVGNCINMPDTINSNQFLPYTHAFFLLSLVVNDLYKLTHQGSIQWGRGRSFSPKSTRGEGGKEYPVLPPSL